MKIFKRNGQVLQSGVPFELEQTIEVAEEREVDGQPVVVTSQVAGKVSYPWNWLDLATPEDLKERGITFEEVPDHVPIRQVRKSVIISRLTDAQLSQAIGMLTVRQQERWRAPDCPVVNENDPEVLAIIKAVGADPAVVLAVD